MKAWQCEANSCLKCQGLLPIGVLTVLPALDMLLKAYDMMWLSAALPWSINSWTVQNVEPDVFAVKGRRLRGNCVTHVCYGHVTCAGNEPSYLSTECEAHMSASTLGLQRAQSRPYLYTLGGQNMRLA